MDKKTLSIIFGLALIASFFLPLGSAGSGSAFDIVKGPSYGTGIQSILMKYIWLVFPVSGLMLLIGALNNGNYPGGRGIWAWLPLLAIIYILIVAPMVNGMAIGDVFKGFGKGFGIGLWIALVASVLAAFANPRSR